MAAMANDVFDINDWLNLPPSPMQVAETGAYDSIEARCRVSNDASTQPSNLDLGSNVASDGTSDGTLTDNNLPCPERVQQPATAPSSLRALKPKPLQSGDKSRGGQAVSFLHSNQSTQGKLPKELRKRRRLNCEGDSYRETRDAGACAQCWMRHVKCDSLIPCNRCVKAAILPALCCRTRVKDLSNHGPGLAHKFIDCFQDCIVRWDETGETKEVKLWHGLHSSFSVKVRQFTPRHDITDLWWKNPTGWMKTRHTPFGICGKVDDDPHSLDAYVYAQIPFILDQVQAKDQGHGRLPGQYGPEVPSPPKGSGMWLRTMRCIYNYVKNSSESQEILRCALLLWAYTFLIYHALWQFTSDENHDKLGMAQLVLDNHDCETLTDFSNATPLPRLLLLQIHACMEARMHILENSLVSALHHSYRSLLKSPQAPDSLRAYLATWVYLSILEEVAWDAGRWKNLREQFDWPLPDRSPDSNFERATSSANTVVAHYQMAVKNEKISDMYVRLFDREGLQGLGQTHRPSDPSMDRDRSIQILFRETRSFATSEKPELNRRLKSTFHAEDIRSLEMKFAAMMIS